ncbi:PilW family protein [Marinobacter zhejiangensis]|uniref:Type IV pilus assembly protein PilW n=1 Tax=Marinobacter zhejiangensis TaxID=488535 RepID=A0A1I4S801_9GAMM|nr:PilW family protein [Marinobacter zhejiangensis]SFM60471.1 type IV pilus assembly protein PilW [Marinobacter zhejiangensis]
MIRERRFATLELSREFGQRGLSLVELMVALALSTVLILGVMTVYLDSNKTSRVSTSLARIQESGRIGVDIMARDIRMVGFQGCADPMSIGMNIIARFPPTLDFAQSGLRGWEVDDSNWADGTEFDDTAIETRARQGSDVLAVQRGETVPISLTGNMNVPNANLQVEGELGLFEQNDIVLISDCENADLFRITSEPTSGTWAHANGANSNNDNRLSQLYNDSARIMRFSSTVYYVADTGRDDTRGNPIYALYRQTDNMLNTGAASFTRDELVEGVDSMQILYGERLSTDNIRFVPADTVGLDMANVVAVKIGLLISDPEGTRDVADNLTYALPGQNIAPAGAAGATVTHAGDLRVRKTFETSVNLRNRIRD